MKKWNVCYIEHTTGNNKAVTVAACDMIAAIEKVITQKKTTLANIFKVEEAVEDGIRFEVR